MQYDEFITKVAQGAAVSREEAEALTAATLRTLAERISRGEAEDLAAQLPKQLKEYLARQGEEAEPFGLDEFVRRVAERAGTDPDQAFTHVGAVFATLREAVTTGELDDISAQLPEELRGLIGVRPRA